MTDHNYVVVTKLMLYYNYITLNGSDEYYNTGERLLVTFNSVLDNEFSYVNTITTLILSTSVILQ